MTRNAGAYFLALPPSLLVTTRRSSALLFILVVLCSCEKAPSPKFVSEQNVGAGGWDSVSAWRLDTIPRLRIGGDAENSDALLTRIVSVFRRTDRSIVVANGRPAFVAVFDSEGNLRKKIGRAGLGPGEFQENSLNAAIPLPGDSFYVVSSREYDYLMLFRPEGIWVKDIPLKFPSTPGSPFPTRLFAQREADRQVYLTFPDGAVVAKWINGFTIAGMSDRARAGTGVTRDTTWLYRVSRTLNKEVVYPPLFSVEEYTLFEKVAAANMQRGRWPVADGCAAAWGGCMMIGTEFRPHAWFATHKDRLYYAPGDFYGYMILAPDGKRRQVTRSDAKTRPVTQADITAARKVRLDRFQSGDPKETDLIAHYRKRYMALEYPSVMAATDRIIVDNSGNVWLREYLSPADSVQRWAVFSDDGAFRGVVIVPLGLMVRQIGGDFVLGQMTNEDGVDYAVLCDLIKPRRGK
jgi:hypothetical protein